MRSVMQLVGVVLVAAWAGQAWGEVQGRAVGYEHDGVQLEGYLAHDPAADEPRGAVVVVHEWWGLNDYAKQRARDLAELGYVAFAVDMYGKGKVTDDPEQAGQWAGAIYEDRQFMRQRAIAGVEAFGAEAELGDDAPVAAIGYCFGGTTVTELAYSGTPGFVGVVSFHGNPKPAQEGDTIDASVLICHGDADGMVTDESLDEVTASLDAHDADWVLIRYADAKHSFTNPKADALGMDAVGYNATAARRAWDHMRLFLQDVFSE